MTNKLGIYINNISCCFLIFMAVTFLSALRLNADVCWKDSYTRGVGTVPSTCGTGQVKSGLLCYKNMAGYTNVAGVAWQNCPAGFRDDGAYCAKPGSYGRGAGYALWDEGKCNKENSQGCEKNGLMWYPKCKPNFHAVGCCVCSPDCQAGMTDIGVSCQKKSTVLSPISPGCPHDSNLDAGLCYKTCKKNYNGIGPVCWGGCPAGMTDCGAMCGPSKDSCINSIKGSIAAGIKAIANIKELAETKGSSGVAEIDKSKEDAKAAGERLLSIMEENHVDFDDLLNAHKGEEKLEKDGYEKIMKALGGKDGVLKLQKAKAADAAGKSDAWADFQKNVDPTGLVDFAESFDKPICGKR